MGTGRMNCLNATRLALAVVLLTDVSGVEKGSARPSNYPGKCPNDCNNRGKCQGFSEVYFPPVCVCDEGYEGVDCGQKVCPRRCMNHGECNVATGECSCLKPWTGADCSMRRCPDGKKIVGPEATCESKLAAKTKDLNYIKPKIPCPKNCSDHGRCEPTDGTCLCHFGWQGKDCSRSPCKDDCNKHGLCLMPKPSEGYSFFGGSCICDEGYFGEYCQIVPAPCPGNCSARGECKHYGGPTGPGTCKCFPPWEGADCSYANGCIPGYHGTTPGCRNDCSCHGICLGSICKCEPGYAGDDCAIEIPL